MIKLLDILNEVKIVAPNILWDLTRYIPNFDPTKIKIGDEIKIKPKRRIPNVNYNEYIKFKVEDIERSDEYGRLDPEGDTYFFMFNNKQNAYADYQLQWFNTQNK
jgi:hypothetical protein